MQRYLNQKKFRTQASSAIGSRSESLKGFESKLGNWKIYLGETEYEMKSQVQKFIDQKIKSQLFSGASLVFGRPFEKNLAVHSGQLAIGSSIPVNSSTVFDLQSITKAVGTSLLFLALESENGAPKIDEMIDGNLP